VFLDGAPVGSGQCRGSLGYCPQSDSMYRSATVRDHFRLYAMIRGISDEDMEEALKAIASPIDLASHLDKKASDLSGGNKRKMGLASALFGLPPVIVADEVTTGIDPGARRAMWGLIAEARKGSSMLWSTHSMEEAEATGDRVCVMAKGRVLALGTPAELIRIHGGGIRVEVEVGNSNGDGQEAMQRVEAAIQERFSAHGNTSSASGRDGGTRSARLLQDTKAVIEEKTLGAIKFTVERSGPDDRAAQVAAVGIHKRGTSSNGIEQSETQSSGGSHKVRVSAVLREMETMVGGSTDISHFVVSQPSLEQVFLKLVREHDEAENNATRALNRQVPTSQA